MGQGKFRIPTAIYWPIVVKLKFKKRVRETTHRFGWISDRKKGVGIRGRHSEGPPFQMAASPMCRTVVK